MLRSLLANSVPWTCRTSSPRCSLVQDAHPSIGRAAACVRYGASLIGEPLCDRLHTCGTSTVLLSAVILSHWARFGTLASYAMHGRHDPFIRERVDGGRAQDFARSVPLLYCALGGSATGGTVLVVLPRLGLWQVSETPRDCREVLRVLGISLYHAEVLPLGVGTLASTHPLAPHY